MGEWGSGDLILQRLGSHALGHQSGLEEEKGGKRPRRVDRISVLVASGVPRYWYLHFLSHFIILNSNYPFLYGLQVCVQPGFLASQCSKPLFWIVSPCYTGRRTTWAHTG